MNIYNVYFNITDDIELTVTITTEEQNPKLIREIAESRLKSNNISLNTQFNTIEHLETIKS